MPLKALIWCAVSTEAQTDADKYSLPQQEADARLVCEREGWQIVDVLRVPGFSRDYIDIYEFADDAAKHGIDAGSKLIDHLAAADFDVFVTRDGDRFGRTQSLLTRIAETIISKLHLRIYTLSDGWIDESNGRMWTAMVALRAASDLDRLTKHRDKGMEVRARRGLPTSSIVPMSHKLIRDLQGKALRLELDETKERLWQDLATVFLEGVGWNSLEWALYERYGHANERGEAYSRGKFYKVLHAPNFWGNSARHWKSGSGVGDWLFEAGHTEPEGVTVYYNTHPAVYTGELAARVIAEIRRRRDVIRGSANPERTHRFSGLLVCGECGYHMSLHLSTGYVGMVCKGSLFRMYDKPTCTQTGTINQKKVQAYIHALLERLLQSEDLRLLLPVDANDDDSAARSLSLVRSDIEEIEAKVRRLIVKQATADESVHDLYQEQIDNLAQQLKIQRARLIEVEQKQQRRQPKRSQRQALEELQALTLEGLWQRDNRSINQMLHRLFDNQRLYVVDKEVRGIVDKPPRRSRRY